MINWHGEERERERGIGYHCACESTGLILIAHLRRESFLQKIFPVLATNFSAQSNRQGEVLIWLRVSENMTRLQHADVCCKLLERGSEGILRTSRVTGTANQYKFEQLANSSYKIIALGLASAPHCESCIGNQKYMLIN